VSHASGIKPAFRKGKKINRRFEEKSTSSNTPWEGMTYEKIVTGSKKYFETPELLLKGAIDYFNWSKDHPLYESRLASRNGKPVVIKMKKLRALTLKGLCSYLGTNSEYFKTFRNHGKAGARIDYDLFEPVIQFVEQTIYNQKFEAAAADLLNANIISRDLGLADKSEIDLSVPRKSVEELFPEELKSSE
jgi:hypothetical protein